MELREVLQKSTFIVSKNLYSVAQVTEKCDFSKCFLVSRDEIETTVIYNQSIPLCGILEEKRNYTRIGINVAIPFYAPGFIATIGQCLAKLNIPILVVSTYSRDYFFVTSSNLETTIITLKTLGLQQLDDEVQKFG